MERKRLGGMVMIIVGIDIGGGIGDVIERSIEMKEMKKIVEELK